MEPRGEGLKWPAISSSPTSCTQIIQESRWPTPSPSPLRNSGGADGGGHGASPFYFMSLQNSKDRLTIRYTELALVDTQHPRLTHSGSPRIFQERQEYPSPLQHDTGV